MILILPEDTEGRVQLHFGQLDATISIQVQYYRPTSKSTVYCITASYKGLTFHYSRYKDIKQ